LERLRDAFVTTTPGEVARQAPAMTGAREPLRRRHPVPAQRCRSAAPGRAACSGVPRPFAVGLAAPPSLPDAGSPPI